MISTKVGVIKNQKDLDEVMKEENGYYYISLNGMVAMFSNNVKLNLIEANDKLEQISRGSAEAIEEAKMAGDDKEVSEYLNTLIKTYLVPFRVH
jgi:hypothetical protein